MILLNNSGAFTKSVINGVLLIRIPIIWMNQDLLLAWNNVQRLFFLLKRRRHSQNKMAIVNGQPLLNTFVLLAEIFHPFLLLRVNISLKICANCLVIHALYRLTLIICTPIFNL